MHTPLPIAALAAASHVAPSLVAPFFRRLMLKPRRHVRPPPTLDLPTGQERLDLGDGLIAWRWSPGQAQVPTVLLVHGFEGHRGQFAAMVDALMERGYAAVAIDVPAHGDSEGDELTAVIFTDALERALDRLAPIHAVIGHSMGGAMALHTLATRTAGRCTAPRVALISAPSALGRELRRFAASIGLSRRGTRAFIRSVEKHVGRPADDFDVRNVAASIDMPVLLIHDQNDRQVPVFESARAAHMLSTADLMVTQGLGHNRLLADPKVIAAVVRFVGAHETMGSVSTL
ncbi:MAG: alpha/beta fold hydrolase [Enhydrobacter sp.]|nr:MAG: alpha/beta fold hydrolase [Enhydrobacter sp.]